MDLTREHLERALAGDRAATRALVDALTPVVQARVARILLRHAARHPGRDIRQEVQDFVQDAFVALFADGGKLLRSWDPARGLSLRNFVGLVAERRSVSRLRIAKRNPWTEDLEGAPEQPTSERDGPEVTVAARQLVEALAERVRNELTPLGGHLFRLLFVEERSVAEVCDVMTMTPNAVYAWRSRLGQRVRQFTQEILSDTGASRRQPKGVRE